MREPWLIFAASVAVIGVAYLADLWLADALRHGVATFQTHLPAAYGGVARLVLVGAVAGLGWLALRGPRDRLAGAAMVLVGLYLALAPIYPAVLMNTGVPMPPLTDALGFDLSGWASAAVVVLGVIMILWPSPADRLEPRAPVASEAHGRSSP